MLCDLLVDLNPLLPFSKYTGNRGVYYRADFDIVITFGPELSYSLVRAGRVFGSITAKYV